MGKWVFLWYLGASLPLKNNEKPRASQEKAKMCFPYLWSLFLCVDTHFAFSNATLLSLPVVEKNFFWAITRYHEGGFGLGGTRSQAVPAAASEGFRGEIDQETEEKPRNPTFL